MKKLLFAICILLAASVGTFAASDTQTSSMLAEKNISASIQGQIHFPEFLRDREGESVATIIFQINASGSISVKDILTPDDDLKADLLAQTPNIKIDAVNLDTRDTYRVVVRFKTL